MLPATPSYEIDTSVLVRLLTDHPHNDYLRTVAALREIENLVDRLIANDYQQRALPTLTNDQRMSRIENVIRLR